MLGSKDLLAKDVEMKAVGGEKHGGSPKTVGTLLWRASFVVGALWLGAGLPCGEEFGV